MRNQPPSERQNGVPIARIPSIRAIREIRGSLEPPFSGLRFLPSEQLDLPFQAA